MTPEEPDWPDVTARVLALQMDVAELKGIVGMQTALIGRLFAEIAMPADPRTRLNEMLATLEGSIDRQGAKRPPDSLARNLLSKLSNDIIEYAEMALADRLANRARNEQG